MGLQLYRKHRLCHDTEARSRGIAPAPPDLKDKEIFMHTVLWFWLGTTLGSFVGVFTIRLLQASRCNINEEVMYE